MEETIDTHIRCANAYANMQEYEMAFIELIEAVKILRDLTAKESP